jgi:hypothetical protein
MLKVELDEAAGIAILEPDGELSESDFVAAAKIIDPYLDKSDELKGILIHVKSFPGWDSFASLIAHLKFVRAHHRKVARVAFATDSPIGGFAEDIASHFVNAEIKNFDFNELEAARKWILDREAE